MDVSNVVHAHATARGRRTLDTRTLSAPPTLLRQVDGAVLRGRDRGNKSALVRSRLPDEGNRIVNGEDIVSLIGLGYRDVIVPLTNKFVNCDHCGHQAHRWIEKSVDARLVTLLYQAAIAVPDGDTIALVSGDGDFFEAILNIQNTFEVKVEVWSFSHCASRRYAGKEELQFHLLDSILQPA